MTDLTAVSLFAGVGGFDLALQRSGVDVVAAVEIDNAARGVLADQFPETTLFTDVREVTGDDLRAAGFVPERGILTAGFPCQDLSVAGHRRGLGEGTRSGLFWEIDRLVADLRPAWIVLENVPGLLSATCPCPGTGDHGGCSEPHQVPGGYCEGGCFPAHGGAMGLVLGALADRGYGFAYRVLDAQHFGVPQRRRRVFIVGCAGGDARGPVQVLLEPEGRAGDSAAGGEAGEGTPGGATVSTLQGGGERGYRIDAEAAAGGHLIPTIAAAITAREGKGPDSDATTTLVRVAATLTAGNATGAGVRAPGRRREDDENIVAHTLTGEGYDASEDGTGRGTPIVPMAFNPRTAGDMRLGYGEKPTALSCTQETAVHLATAVRRLTPMECERLQGFPDRWTATSNGRPQADAARYRQCGNAIAVPAGWWVVSRTVQVDAQERQMPERAEDTAA